MGPGFGLGFSWDLVRIPPKFPGFQNMHEIKRFKILTNPEQILTKFTHKMDPGFGSGFSWDFGLDLVWIWSGFPRGFPRDFSGISAGFQDY